MSNTFCNKLLNFLLITIVFFHRTQWLYDASDVIFPSVYMTEKTIPKNRPPMVRGRVKESMRLSRNVRRSAKPLVIVYHRYKFTDSLQYLSEVCTLLYRSVVSMGKNIDSKIFKYLFPSKSTVRDSFKKKL